MRGRMRAVGSSFWFLLFTLSNGFAKDDCLNQVFLNSLDLNRIHTKLSSYKDCSQINFEGSEKLSTHLGSIKLAAFIQDETYYGLNVSFYDIKWTKAFLKLSQEHKPETITCKAYSAENQLRSPILEVSDTCFNAKKYTSNLNYFLEFKAELNTDILYKKLVFSFPSLESFGNAMTLSKRAIFTSVDTSSNYGIVLKIQPLPPSYNVTYYKVEVFKEKDSGNSLLDVRMLSAGDETELSFEYITYNDEGHYFFKVSAVNDICSEDACLKSVTPRIYIKRKYPPLVIGIVGASFVIPFVLFILHMWTRRSQLQDENEEQRDKVFLIYNQTPERHYQIVKSLEKSLKTLTKVEIVNKISDATHILYICGTHIFEPDPVTHKFLVIEANKAMSNVEILIVSFPYSTKEIPPYLKNCLRFGLMDDFSKFIHVFNCEAEFEDNEQYLDLSGKVTAAQIHTEPRKIILNMPVIIITEQTDSDTEPKEADVLL